MFQARASRKAPVQHLPANRTESFRVMEVVGTRTGCSWHFHPECQLSLVLGGTGQRVIGDDFAPIERGELTLLGANLPHVWHYDPPSYPDVHAIVVHFREGFAGDEFLRKPEMREVRRLLASADRGVQFHGETRGRVEGALCRMPRLRGLERMVALMQILDLLARSTEATAVCSAGIRPVGGGVELRRLRDVCDHVDRNIDGVVNRDDAAAVAHLSPSAFSRFFKQHTGVTFQSFLNQRRIGVACAILMDDGELSVTEVAFRCGFVNVTSFNRCFRRVMRASPTEYRQRLAGVLAGGR